MYASLRRSRAPLILAAGLAAACLALCAPSPLAAEARADLALVSVAADPASPWARIVGLALRVQLEAEGLDCALLPDLEAAAAGEPAAILGRPEARGAACLLAAESAQSGDRLELRLSWFDHGAGRWIAELSRSLPLDMRLDEGIFKAVDELLRTVEAAAPVPRQKVPQAQSLIDSDQSFIDSDQSVEATGQTVIDADQKFTDSDRTVIDPDLRITDSDQSFTDSGPSVIDSGPIEASTAPTIKLPDEPKPPRGLELGLGGSAFIGAGSLGSYLELSGGGSARASWFFPGRALSLGLGLELGCQAFTAKGPLESAQGLLAPALLELRLAFAGRGPRPLARLGAGAALLYLDTELYGTRWKILPCALAGLGLEYRIAAGLGFELELSCLALIDGQDILAAFSPRLGLTLPVGDRP